MGVQLIKIVDRYIGGPLCALLSLCTQKQQLVGPRKILLIQLWGIGETILTLPTLEQLRKRFPKTEITMLCTPRNKEVYYNNKHLSKVKVINTSISNILSFTLDNLDDYDIVIDMEEYLNISAIIAWAVGKHRIGYNHGARAGVYNQKIRYNDKQHVAQTFMDLLQPLGVKKRVSTLLPLTVSSQDKSTVEKVLKRKKIPSRFIICSPGAAESSKMRMWANDKWSELINNLHTKKKTIVLVGGPEHKELNEQIMKKVKNKKGVHNLAGQTSVRGLFYLIQKAKAIVSIDSGPMHIGAAQKTPTIGLFSPNTPVRFGPLGKECVSIYKPITKHPVINVHKGEVPEDNRDYLKHISVNDVLKALNKLTK